MTRVLWWVQKGVPHPMKNPAIREKVIETKKRLYAEGKIVPWNKGIPCTEETRRKISETLKGKPLSEETKRKLSEARKGKPKSEEWRKNISKGQMGRCRSEETKKKIGEVSKKRWQNPDYRRRLSAIRKTWVGPKHPRWKGGNRGYRGSNWPTMIRRARKWYDNTCQVCGSSGKIVIHHIIPYRIAKDNSLPNLIALCRGCHMKVERGDIVLNVMREKDEITAMMKLSKLLQRPKFTSNRDILNHLYWDKGLTFEEIGKISNVCQTSVLREFKRLGLPTRPRWCRLNCGKKLTGGSLISEGQLWRA